jgi:hypothetical protein
MPAPLEVTALATAIRDHRPADLYADDAARLQWYQLVGAAGLALYGDDEDARRRFSRSAKFRRSTRRRERVSLADEATHEIHVVVPGGPVPPWTTVKHREWRLRHYAWEWTLTDDERALWLMRAPPQWPS